MSARARKRRVVSDRLIKLTVPVPHDVYARLTSFAALAGVDRGRTVSKAEVVNEWIRDRLVGFNPALPRSGPALNIVSAELEPRAGSQRRIRIIVTRSAAPRSDERSRVAKTGRRSWS